MDPTLDDLTSPYTPPISQGRLKLLWDAVRNTPVPDAAPPAAPPQPTPQQASLISGGYMPPPPPPPAPVLPGQLPASGTPLGAAVANLGVSRLASPPPSSSVSAVQPQMTSPLPDVLTEQPTPSQQPMVRVQNPDISQMPGSGRAKVLQDRLDAMSAPPSLTQKLLGFAPVAAAALLGKFGGGQAGSFAQGIPAGQEFAASQQNIARKSVADQLAAAEQEREKEFDTAQRTQELANAAMEANRTRDIVARELGGSRERVAQIAGQSRENVADTQAGSRERAAAATAASRERIGTAANAARIAIGKYAADAAANRQSRSIAAALDRQGRGFEHSDTKPTSDEDRRADLSTSMGHILDDIEERIGRRPELIGPIAGRATEGRNWIGTNDEDIAALVADKEALGQVMLGAHAMRNATHIGTAANSVMNAYHDGPEAMKSALEQARANANTMQTITRPTLVGGSGGGGKRITSSSSASAPRSTAAPSSATSEPDYIYQVGKGLIPNPKAKAR